MQGLLEKLSKKTVIIGCGTGRCGTKSLTALLNGQKDCYVTHERNPIMSWSFDRHYIQPKLEDFSRIQADFVGDVAFYYLNYIEYLIYLLDSIKVIVLRRDREKTVESYLRKTAGRNHWSRKPSCRDVWDRCYPKYDNMEKFEAISQYWFDYYDKARFLQGQHPSIVKIFDMNQLNSYVGVTDILSFIFDDFVVEVAIKRNSFLKT